MSAADATALDDALRRASNIADAAGYAASQLGAMLTLIASTRADNLGEALHCAAQAARSISKSLIDQTPLD